MPLSWVRHRDVQSPTIATSAYTANDVAGGLLTVDLGGFAGGWVDSICIIDTDNVGAALSFYFFDSAPTALDDGDALLTGLSAADLANMVGPVVPVTSYTAFGTRKRAFFPCDQVSYPIHFDGALYVYMAPTGTPTFTNDDALVITFNLWLYSLDVKRTSL